MACDAAPTYSVTSVRASSKVESSPVRGRKLVFAPVALLVLFGIWAIWLKQQAVDDSKWVQHTQLVQNAVMEVAQDMRAAESGQRGFIITGGEKYLEPWIENRDSVLGDVDHLAALTKDNPQQQALVGLLRPVVKARMERMDSTIATRRRGQEDSALAMVRTGLGATLMDSSMSILRRMQKQEIVYLEARVEKEERDRRLMFFALIGGVALSAIFSVLISLRLSDQAVHQWLVSTELAARNQTLQDQSREYERTIAALRKRISELDGTAVTSGSRTSGPGNEQA